MTARPPFVEAILAPLSPDTRALTERFADQFFATKGTLFLENEDAVRRVWEACRDQALDGDVRAELAGPSAPPQESKARSPDEWGEVIPLSGNEPVPDFPIDVFPKWLADFVDGIRVETQTPAALAGMSAIAALSTAVHGKFAVHARGKLWNEGTNTFGCTILDPSGLKSAVYRPFIAPLDEIEHEQRAAAARTLEATENERKILESDLKRKEGEASKADGPDRVAILAEMNQLSARLAQLPAATLPRYMTANVTSEQLATLMHENGGRMAVLSAEGEIFKIMAGLYTKDRTPDFSVYLKGYSNEKVTVDRKVGPAISIRNPALTVGLMVQPHVLRSMKQNPALRGEGLLSRFLYAIPKNTVGSRDMEPPIIEQKLVDEYRYHLGALFSLPWNEDPSGQQTAYILELTAEAKAKLIAFRRRLEPRMGPGGDLEHIGDWCGKLHGQIARVAGVLHLADHALEREPWRDPIEEGPMVRAIRLCEEFFLPHALAAFREMGADPAVGLANEILAWIRKKRLSEFDRDELHQFFRHRNHRPAAYPAPLALLEETRHIRLKVVPEPEGEKKKGRKPSDCFEVNPKVLASTATVTP